MKEEVFVFVSYVKEKEEGKNKLLGEWCGCGEVRRSKRSCLIFKVDFEKAYDSVSWQFLFYMMRRMGFHERWISWIKGCITSASVSILVSGSPTSEFKPHRGLRKGDPLAPLLFDLVAEGLMREATSKNCFQSFLVGKNKVRVNILQYADDYFFWRSFYGDCESCEGHS